MHTSPSIEAADALSQFVFLLFQLGQPRTLSIYDCKSRAYKMGIVRAKEANKSSCETPCCCHLQNELVTLLFLVQLLLWQGFLWKTFALPWIGSPLAWDTLVSVAARSFQLSSARHQLRSRKSRATSYNLSRKHFWNNATLYTMWHRGNRGNTLIGLSEFP